MDYIQRVVLRIGKAPVNNLKLRASYGVIGNQDIAPFSTLAMMSATTTYYGDSDAITGMGTSMPNPGVSNDQYIGNSTKWLEDADYFRLENITLAYDLKKEVTRFADIHLSFSIQNLFTITGYKGMNPASYSFGGSAAEWQQGIDVGTNPCPRTYTFGARFKF